LRYVHVEKPALKLLRADLTAIDYVPHTLRTRAFSWIATRIVAHLLPSREAVCGLANAPGKLPWTLPHPMTAWLVAQKSG
jgi:hypothetical protein